MNEETQINKETIEDKQITSEEDIAVDITPAEELPNLIVKDNNKFLTISIVVAVTVIILGMLGYLLAPTESVEERNIEQQNIGLITQKEVQNNFERVSVLQETDQKFGKKYDPESQSPIYEYDATGFYIDGIREYSVEEGSFEIYSSEVTKSKHKEYLSWSNGIFFRIGDSIYIYDHDIFGFRGLSEIDGVDIESFEILFDGYARDKNAVYFGFSTIGIGYDTIMVSDPQQFTVQTFEHIVSYEGVEDSIGTETFGVLGEDVYSQHQHLEGIELSKLQILNNGRIIRDDNTAWFLVGGCHSAQWKKGEVSDIDTYKPPC